MKWMNSGEVDKQQWDALVQRSGGTVFSLSQYLDATADNWGILCNEDLTGGIACPFAVKLGVKILYAPFFHRYTEWVGADRPSLETLQILLQQHFPVADAQLRWEFPPVSATKMHQVLEPNDFHPNQQVKRMLKRGAIYTITQGRRERELLNLLQRELSPRVASIDGHSLQLLEQLVAAFPDRELLQLNLLDGTDWKGAIWLLSFNDRMLYLKGTVVSDARNNGGMYRLMEEAIRLAFDRGLLFDFGGSNVDGVRRFNLNWGAKDVTYGALRWNNAPLWWKTIKSLRQTWNNRSSS